MEAMATTDPAAFFQLYRRRRAPLPPALDPVGLTHHFQHLLGSIPHLPTAPPPPTSSSTLNPMAAPFVPAASVPALLNPHATPFVPNALPRVPSPASAPSAPAPSTPPAAGLHAPFTPEEVLKAAARTSGRKAVINCLPPWLLKACPDLLAPLLAAEYNAWQRVGCLPVEEALSIITPILKAGGRPLEFGGYRGIAVGPPCLPSCTQGSSSAGPPTTPRPTTRGPLGSTASAGGAAPRRPPSCSGR